METMEIIKMTYDYKLLKRLNLTKVIASFLACFLLISCSENTTEKANEEEIADIVERGTYYLENGQFRAASIEARNAIKINEKAPEGHLLLNEILVLLGQSRQAITNLEKLPFGSNANYLLLLSKAYIERRKFSSSINILSSNEKLLSLPPTSFAHNLHYAKAYAGLKQFEKSEVFLANAASLSDNTPQNIEKVDLQRAKNLIAQDQSQIALQILDKTIAKLQNPEALLLKSSIVFNAGDLESAEDLLTQSLFHLKDTDIISPLRMKILQGLIQTLTRRGHSAEALIYSQVLAKAAPEAEGNLEQLNEALDLFAEGNLDDAEKVLLKLYSNTGNNEITGRLLGLIQSKKGRYEDAAKLLEENIDPEVAPIEAIKLLAETHLRANQAKKVLGILKKKSKENPKDAEIMGIYGLALLAAEETELAEKSINQALKLDPSKTQLLVALSKHYNKQKQYKKSLDILAIAYKKTPNSELVQLNYIEQLKNLNLLDQGSLISKEALKANPDSPVVLSVAAEVSLKIGKTTEAKQLFSRASQLTPTPPSSLLGLAKISIQEQDIEKAKSHLRATIEIAPNVIDAYRGLFFTGDKSTGQKEAIAEVVQYSITMVDAWAPSAALAEYYLRTKNFQKSETHLLEALARSESNRLPKQIALNLYHAWATESITSNDLSAARVQLMKGLQVSPHNLHYTVLLTHLEIRAEQYREVRKLIDQISTRWPSLNIAKLLEGDLFYKQKQYSDAIASYRESWNSTPTEDLAEKILGLMLENSSQKSSQAFFTEWVQHFPKSPRPYLVQSQHHFQAKQLPKAIKTLEAGLTATSNSSELLNNLAWFHFKNGDIETALKIARSAYDANKSSANIVDTYGWILVESGQTQLGIKYLEEALALAPSSTDISDHLRIAKYQR